MNIPFNKPHLTGKEAHYMYQAVFDGKLSGNGEFTKRCQHFMEQKYGFRKCLLTTSCTDALEMAALLCELHPGDEVIVPSYTFVSSALAFVREGAKIVFADSMKRNPNIDAEQLESLITPRTKVIVPVHYAGVACDMDAIMDIANRHNLIVVEDAAQAIDSYYISPRTGKKCALGTIGHLSAFSFHETKNIISGEGGMLGINDERFIRRAEIIWEKGTNRAEFFRGEVNKYGWVDTGSSFLPSEVVSAFLWAQLEDMDNIQNKRKHLWNLYYSLLSATLNSPHSTLNYSLPDLPTYATNNAHMFYLVCRNLEERTALIKRLKENGVLAVFHYLSLHSSPYYAPKHDGRALPECDRYADCLVRLPMYYDLTEDEVHTICQIITDFFAH
ncbi:MAG: dTDP-4-amino-4,6-dideoxygalactose transaminase [Paludibacteraceae bacterium]|nr:dTDP-4-amino-4,6-dideoxygalactose transaminase [Bacteroidales bacterium]MDY4148796.1 dTDP-4-amino-4,6-dideoxygalactose transaminase [Paludibacteraceae bacterium]